MEGEHLFSARSSETGRRQADTGKTMMMIAIVMTNVSREKHLINLMVKYFGNQKFQDYFAIENVLFLSSPPPKSTDATKSKSVTAKDLHRSHFAASQNVTSHKYCIGEQDLWKFAWGLRKENHFCWIWSWRLLSLFSCSLQCPDALLLKDGAIGC